MSEVKWTSEGMDGCDWFCTEGEIHSFDQPQCGEKAVVRDESSSAACCQLHYDEMLAKEKPVELVCEYTMSHVCEGSIKEYKRDAGWNRAFCEFAATRGDYPKVYTPIEPDAPEVKENNDVKYVYDRATRSIFTVPKQATELNAAMIKRDKLPVPKSWAELCPSQSPADPITNDELLARAWNRSNKLPRVVNFDPYIPRVSDDNTDDRRRNYKSCTRRVGEAVF